MANQLEPSYENIKRADRKFGQLKGTINDYLASARQTVRVECDATKRYEIGSIDNPLPEDVPWETVDIVLRLRAALDKAVVAMVEGNGRGTSGIGFPFGGYDRSTGQVLEFPSQRMIGKGGIKEKLTAAQWGIIEAAKPHPGGNEALWAINEIANEDKHRKGLVRVTTGFGNHTFEIIGGSARWATLGGDEADRLIRDKERETLLLTVPIDSDLRAKHSSAIHVVFGELMPVTGKNVLVTLNQQIRMVKHILNQMRRLL